MFYSLARCPESLMYRQGTGHGRILAPFMYKVYINGLLNVLTNHYYSISVNRLSFPSPSSADDVTLLALYPTFLHTFMEMCYEYSIKWRYEFDHIKSGVVTFGECKLAHYENMNERKWLLGDESVDELYECKNLGVLMVRLWHGSRFLILKIEKSQ